jgi:undecaprenyl-phosphate galactose phosphotransferase
LLVLILTDLGAVGVSLEIAILARVHLLPAYYGSTPADAFTFWHYASNRWIWALAILFLAAEGLYTRRRTLWDEVANLVKATGLGLLAIMAVIALGQLSVHFSRFTIVFAAMVGIVVLPLTRYWTKSILGATGLWRKPVLILGATPAAERSLEAFDGDPVLGYSVLGVLDDDPARQNTVFGQSHGRDVKVLGPLAMAKELIAADRSRDVLVAMPDIGEKQLLLLMHELQPLCNNLYLVPNVAGMPMMNLQVNTFLDHRLLMLKAVNNLAKPWNRAIKQSFDLVVGTLLLLPGLPLMALIAILVRLESRGPAILAQTRLGYRDRDFRCLKFRTMQEDAEERLAEVLNGDAELAEEWEKYAKLRSRDPRLTRLGRFLRRHSLDELPQILNVVKGEMSLVGPRPYLPRERERIGSELDIILETRPGMTGFWQVRGRNRLAFEDRVRLEGWYVRNWSLWFDLIILARTLKTVLAGKDAS